VLLVELLEELLILLMALLLLIVPALSLSTLALALKVLLLLVTLSRSGLGLGQLSSLQFLLLRIVLLGFAIAELHEDFLRATVVEL